MVAKMVDYLVVLTVARKAFRMAGLKADLMAGSKVGQMVAEKEPMMVVQSEKKSVEWKAGH